MNTLQRYSILLITVLFTSTILQGQNTNNQEMIKNLYDILQNSKASSNDITVLIPGIKWEDVKYSREDNERSSITLDAIMKKEWGSIVFEKLDIRDTEKNEVIVTGIVNGRQPTECEFTSTRFKHSWDLKDGKIVSFKEY
ncbi:hypothetical protein ACKGJN_08640 [Gillisia sp. Q332]|uniref:hypothetical protein n=1 Tax=Gillisia xinjiangensis TaxID=3384765 RepID=UPI0039196232